MWSSRRRKSYLGITVFWHVEDESFNVILSCDYFSGRHTSIRIPQSLIAEINSWGINEIKITTFVSDNGSDMVKCFESVIPSIYREDLDDIEQGAQMFSIVVQISHSHIFTGPPL